MTNGTVYVMLTSRSSRDYADIALDSFFKSTTLLSNEEFYLIDNDNEGTYNLKLGTVISNSEPKSFSSNVNTAINIANGRDIVLLSNDIVFTPKWNEPLRQYSNAILIPACNQTHVYVSSDLHLEYSMKIGDYANRYKELADISQQHKRASSTGFFERLLMAFYAFKLPANVYNKVGLFDEGFGTAGGEDVDYRLRALQQGFPVKYIISSYLLHFGGKSTWDGPEKPQEIQERDQKYFDAFSKKWGEDLAHLCLVGGQARQVVEKYNLYPMIQNQDFSGAIKAVLNIRHRN